MVGVTVLPMQVVRVNTKVMTFEVEEVEEEAHSMIEVTKGGEE